MKSISQVYLGERDFLNCWNKQILIIIIYSDYNPEARDPVQNPGYLFQGSIKFLSPENIYMRASFSIKLI